MNITGVKAVYPKYQHVAPSWRTHFWQIVVRVESDRGVTGFGYGGGGVASVEVVNRHLRELLVGRRIDSVEDIRDAWDALYAESLPYGRKGIGVMALSGIDLALWDLLGRAEGKPVYKNCWAARRRRGSSLTPPETTQNGTGIPGSRRISFPIAGTAVIPALTALLPLPPEPERYSVPKPS